MAFSMVFNIKSGIVRGVMPKLNDIDVVLAQKELKSAKFKNQKQSQLKKNKNSPSNRIFLDRKGNKQLGMGFLVNKSLKVTSTNLVNESEPENFYIDSNQKDSFKSKSTPTGVKISELKKIM